MTPKKRDAKVHQVTWKGPADTFDAMYQDAQRFRFLKHQYVGADFSFDTGSGVKEPVLIFLIPDGGVVSANLAATIDGFAALLAPISGG